MASPWKLFATLVSVLLLTAITMDTSRADSLFERDHELARQALQAGEVLPLRTILERIEHEHPGQIVEIEMARDEDDHWIYDVELLRPNGVLIILEIDARNGKVLKTYKLGGAPQRRGNPNENR